MQQPKTTTTTHLVSDLIANLNWNGQPVPVRWTQGLSTPELDRAARALNLTSFCGTGYREAIHDVEHRFLQREPWASSCVINTAPEGQVKGEHWVCLYYDPGSDLQHTLEYFDPAGILNFLPSVTCLMEELSPFHPVVQNQHPLQNALDTTSPACGFH